MASREEITLQRYGAERLSLSPNDVGQIEGSGAPVDGQTGAGALGKGSTYTDITNVDLYINAGSKASPVWKLIAREA